MLNLYIQTIMTKSPLSSIANSNNNHMNSLYDMRNDQPKYEKQNSEKKRKRIKKSSLKQIRLIEYKERKKID